MKPNQKQAIQVRYSGSVKEKVTFTRSCVVNFDQTGPCPEFQ